MSPCVLGKASWEEVTWRMSGRNSFSMACFSTVCLYSDLIPTAWEEQGFPAAVSSSFYIFHLETSFTSPKNLLLFLGLKKTLWFLFVCLFFTRAKDLLSNCVPSIFPSLPHLFSIHSSFLSIPTSHIHSHLHLSPDSPVTISLMTFLLHSQTPPNMWPTPKAPTSWKAIMSLIPTVPLTPLPSPPAPHHTPYWNCILEDHWWCPHYQVWLPSLFSQGVCRWETWTAILWPSLLSDSHDTTLFSFHHYSFGFSFSDHQAVFLLLSHKQGPFRYPTEFCSLGTHYLWIF